MEDDYFNLRRFIEAQKYDYESVLRELKSGRKHGHWMWYIFPQIRGLGWSAMSLNFGISGKDEARAYLEHTILGPRLRECTQLVIKVECRSAGEIFDDPDDLKFRSCMTLFAETSTSPDIFRTALQKYFRGAPDILTLGILREQAGLP